MKTLLLTALFVIGAGRFAAAGDLSSAYSDLDTETGCTVFASAGEGDGEWADLVCDGYRGFPVFLYENDLRETAFYGFPPAGDLAPAWESFAAFNSVGPKIEWRVETSNGNAVPFATIHRRLVSGDGDGGSTTEVLVVSKVGQIDAREGCVVGLVLASGHPEANEAARKIADQRVRNFVCGTDQPISVGSPMPHFSRDN